MYHKHPNTESKRQQKSKFVMLVLAGVFLGLFSPLTADHHLLPTGPGIGQLNYSEDELFNPISALTGPDYYSWGNAAYFNGYLVIGFDREEDSSGIQVWNLENPRDPIKVLEKLDADTRQLREIQNFSFTSAYGADLAVIPSHEGIAIWDFSDMTNPARVGGLEVTLGGGKGIYNGIISAFWQPPYIYLGGQNTGMYVVDATDPYDMQSTQGNLVHIPPVNLNNQLAGPIYAVGNLLIATSMEGNANGAYSLFDVSNPMNPVMITSHLETESEPYTTFFNGGKLYGLGVDGHLYVYEIRNGYQIERLYKSTEFYGRGGYAQFQDGILHAGMSEAYWKIDVTGSGNSQSLGTFSFPHDDDWAVVLGNLVFVGDDDGIPEGPGEPHSLGYIIPHQIDPDAKGPEVNMVNPASSSVQIPLTSKVGLSFSDNIDHHSVDETALIIRPLNGEALPGMVSTQNGLVNFTPLAPLSENTTYEIYLPSGGVKDYAGNGIENDYHSFFSTGTELDPGVSIGKHGFANDPNLKFSISRVSGKDVSVQLSQAPVNRDGALTLQIFNLRGEELYTVDHQMSTISSQGTFNVFLPDHLKTGLYQVRLRQGSASATVLWALGL